MPDSKSLTKMESSGIAVFKIVNEVTNIHTLSLKKCYRFLKATILKEDHMGFVFESNRSTKHCFTAETTLGQEFAVGWGGKKGRKLKSKSAMRDKVRVVHLFGHLDNLLSFTASFF